MDQQQDQTTTEPAPPLRWAGIDWSWSEHAICVVDEEGVAVERTTVEHSGAGLTRMITLLDRNRVAGIAIERGDGPVVQALLEAGLTVFVVASRQVTALRSRYGTAGNKDDRFDAYLLADVLRTDRRRLTPVTTDSPATEGLRMLVRARRDLVAARVAAHNQLHNHLKSAFPGAVGLFSQLDGKTSLAFLTRFPTPQKAGWLSEKRLAAWLQAAHYSNKRTPAQFMAHLRRAPGGLPDGPAADAAAAVTAELVALLTNLRERIAALENHIATALGRTSTRRCSPACPTPARCGRRRCWPRSVTPAAATPPTTLWPPRPGSPPRRALPGARAAWCSAAAATAASAKPWWTSPMAAAPAARGPRPSTPRRAPAAPATLTPYVCSPAPGSA
jgi:transposase